MTTTLTHRLKPPHSHKKNNPGEPLRPNWWYTPKTPHKIYPIDLLPNFGRTAPDPHPEISPISPSLFPYWAVRGTRNPTNGHPETTLCSIKPPPDRNPKDYSPEATKERDVAWLIQGETYTDEYIGSTCRGRVYADNGQPIAAMIDVPGMAVKDIDKIYQAAAKYLSDLTIE